jgi:hypothetical protein
MEFLSQINGATCIRAMRAAEKLDFDPRRAMTLIRVASLAMPEYLIEVEAIA